MPYYIWLSTIILAVVVGGINGKIEYVAETHIAERLTCCIIGMQAQTKLFAR